MKKNIDFYPHKSESHRHPKFKMLRSLFSNPVDGWAAEGRFWALNNLIAQAEDCVLDLSKRRNLGVYADELGLSIEEFSGLISIFSGEDVELLTEVSPGIYTTETVQETYKSVSKDREKAANRYKSSKKIDNLETLGENQEFSGENLETSGEKIYKVNRSEVNGIELNKIKVNKSGKEITSSVFFEKCKKLYQENTHISDPNIKTHIGPIIEIYELIPEDLKQSEVEECIEQTFKTLDKNKGVNVTFLTQNIMAKIAEKHEKILQERKVTELKEANSFRNEQKLNENNGKREINNGLLLQLTDFFNKNQSLFSYSEKSRFVHFCKENDVLGLENLIRPKMDEMSLV